MLFSLKSKNWKSTKMDKDEGLEIVIHWQNIP